MPNSPTILIADDDQDTRDIVRTVVEEYLEYRTITTATGTEAITLALQYKPAVIILDLHLPEKNGFAVARELRQQPEGANIGILAVSGMTRPEDIERALSSGCDDVLTKPFDIAQLEGAIQSLVARRRAD